MKNNKEMKKRGFTLTELIAVIAILSLLIGGSVVIYVNVRKNILDKSYENVVSYLESRASQYAKDTGITTVSVADLIEEGYVDPDNQSDIFDPRDNSSMNCYIIESILKDGDYVATLGKNLIENNECKKYTKTTDLQICIYLDENNCSAEGIGEWRNNNVTLGVKDSGNNILTTDDYEFSWTDGSGYIGNESTVRTSTTLISQDVYKVKVTKKEGNTYGEASANINIDKQMPSILKINYDHNWSNKAKEITIETSDYSGSGIQEIYVGEESDCQIVTYEKINNGNYKISKEVGQYNICLKDNVGNITESDNPIIIDKIDKNKPTILSVNPSTTDYVLTLDLIGNAEDTESGISGYQFTKSDKKPTDGWTKINAISKLTDVKYEVKDNGMYYFWVIDIAGNISKKEIEIKNIGTLKSQTFATYESESGSTIIDSIDLSGIKAVDSIIPDNGEVLDYKINGEKLEMTFANGSRKSGSKSCTDTESPSISPAQSETDCDSYYCPRGGSVSGSTCVGSDISKPVYHSVRCLCSNGLTAGCNNASPQVSCGSHYTKRPNCESANGQSCTSHGNVSVFCDAVCEWDGDYSASCSGYSTSYYCSSGTRVGTSCYSCSRGTFNSSTKLCRYSTTCTYYYYQYTATINYVI